MILCLEIPLSIILSLLIGSVGPELILSRADSAHVLSDVVLLVLRTLLMLLNQVATLIVDLSVLELLSCDLRRSFGEFFHFERNFLLWKTKENHRS